RSELLTRHGQLSAGLSKLTLGRLLGVIFGLPFGGLGLRVRRVGLGELGPSLCNIGKILGFLVGRVVYEGLFGLVQSDLGFVHLVGLVLRSGSRLRVKVGGASIEKLLGSWCRGAAYDGHH